MTITMPRQTKNSDAPRGIDANASNDLLSVPSSTSKTPLTASTAPMIAIDRWYLDAMI